MKKQVVLGPESSSSLHKLESHRHTFPHTSSLAPERGSAEQTSGGHSLQFYRICLRPERLSPAQLAFAVSWLSAGERRESAALRWINLSDTLFFLSRICGNGLVFSSTCTGEMTLQREREREREGKKGEKKKLSQGSQTEPQSNKSDVESNARLSFCHFSFMCFLVWRGAVSGNRPETMGPPFIADCETW